MNRKEFLASLALSTAGIMLNKLPQIGAKKPKMMAWIGGQPKWSDGKWKKELRKWRKAGIKGILLQGNNGGKPELERLIKITQTLDIELHAWTWTLNRPMDTELRKTHPEYFSVSREGKSVVDHPPYVGYYRWLCPSREPVQEYTRGRMKDLAQYSELASIHLDYVRHPDVILPIGLQPKYNLVQDREYPEFDYCYCDVCQEKFKALTGDTLKDIEDPTAHEAWRKFRWDSVTNLVNKIADDVHQKNAKLSAAVFPYPDLARKIVRQSWDEWNLDMIFPMIYHNFYNEDHDWIESSTRKGVTALNGRFPLYTGLFVPSIPPEELESAVRKAMNGGASGVCFFSAKSLKKEHLKVLRGLEV